MILNGIAAGIPGQVNDTFIPLATQVAPGTILLPRFGYEVGGGVTPGGGNLMCCPIVVYGAHTISALVCNVLTAGTASTVVRLGLFNNDPLTGKPGTLLVDAGTAAATSTGVKTLLCSPTAITPGLYWTAAVFQTVTGSPAWAAIFSVAVFPAGDAGTWHDPPESSYYEFSVAGALAASYAFVGGVDTRAPYVGILV